MAACVMMPGRVAGRMEGHAALHMWTQVVKVALARMPPQSFLGYRAPGNTTWLIER